MTSEIFTTVGSRVTTDVKNKFGDIGGVQITDEMLLRWVNDGIRSIASTNPFLKRVSKTALLAGQQTYDFSTAFPTSRIQQFDTITVAGRPAQVIPFSQFLELTNGRAAVTDFNASKDDTFITEYGGVLTLYPVPTTTVADGLVIYFSAYPAEVTDITAVLPIPDRFVNSLTDYVYAQALQLDENWEAAGLKLQHHEAALAREFERENRSPTDVYPSITLTEDDGWGPA